MCGSACLVSGLRAHPKRARVVWDAIGLQLTKFPFSTGWEEYIQRVFARWSQMRSKKDGSLPKPHWAKWDSRWVPGLVDYIKEVRKGGRGNKND